LAEAPEDLTPRLAAALTGRYTVQRPLGSGGMATVYLATDIRHSRQVAIKVLRPELGAMMGPVRFLREIKLAATLSHPHILPLLDSGEADGLLFYVMPFVAGESLGDRLRREIQLPVDDALAIACEVAEALAYAHGRGVVHRDIKPGNILLAGGHALVADFGIARALDDVGGERLTLSGLAMGTPHYMSPEQASGHGPVDPRSDIYSLGCVLYEMLGGDPPFTGPSAQAVLARHSLEPVRHLHVIRSTISPAVEAVVERALAKIPADRFATATKFVAALQNPAAAAGALEARGARLRWPRRSSARAVIGAVFVVLAALSVLWYRGCHVPVPDPQALAVLPFRAAADARESARALADLLAQRFPGDGGPRAVDPATVGAAVARVGPANANDLTLDEAMRVGRRVRAGTLLVGQAARAGGRLVVSASLVAVPGGAVLARADEVPGSADSLPDLADRVARELLARSAGESGERLVSLLGSPLPALRSYLDGQRALERGAFAVAARRFSAALDADSTLAVAALGLTSTGPFLSDSARKRGYDLAWAARDRLGPRDRILLRALLGGYTGPHGGTQGLSYADQLLGWEAAIQALPDRADAWWGFAEALFHFGPWLGRPEVSQRTSAAFRRVLDLNPSHVPAIGHLIDLYASEDDTAQVRIYGRRYAALDTAGDLADYYGWRVARALSDGATLERLRHRFDQFSTATLERIIASSQLDGLPMEDAHRAVAALEKQFSRPGLTNVRRYEIALNAGRPHEAARLFRQQQAGAPVSPGRRLILVAEALTWGADTTDVAPQMARIADQVEHMAPRRDADPTTPQLNDVCAAGLWRLAHNKSRGVSHAIAVLESARTPLNSYMTGYVAICAQVLKAELADVLRAPDAANRLAQLDSLMRTGPTATSWLMAVANLAIARLQEAHGNIAAALAATRRRARIVDLGEVRVLVALSTFVREEGRLAALTGDTAAAVRAYRRYLALREDPEPALRAEVDRVRGELARLTTSAGQRRP
jgi:serine/threonine-protein kinase